MSLPSRSIGYPFTELQRKARPIARIDVIASSAKLYSMAVLFNDLYHSLCLTYVVGTKKNHLTEMVLLCSQNKC